MKCTTETGVEYCFDAMPKSAREQLRRLRSLILRVAKEQGIDSIQECLRWGEPSYIAKGGSTVRLNWSAKRPDEVRLMFHCQTRLVDTFKELFKEQLSFEGNRAIVLALHDELPDSILAQCIQLALTYKSRKSLPLLGA